MTFHTRAEWVDPPLYVTGPDLAWGKIDTVAIHYTAAVNLPDGDLGEHDYHIPAYIRSIQRDYVNNRGYSIGYNFAVDWLGGVWELRGYDIKCAANINHNDHVVAILVLVDGADPATEHAVHAIRGLILEIQRRAGRQVGILGHRQLPGAATACPGAGLLSQIHSGVFNPVQYDPIEVDMSKVHIHNGIRILDTRDRGTLAEGTFQVAPHGFTPKNAVGVMLHVSVFQAQGPGFVTLWGGADRPNIAQVSYGPNAPTVETGFAMVPLNADGTFNVFTLHPAHVIIDQVGLVEA